MYVFNDNNNYLCCVLLIDSKEGIREELKSESGIEKQKSSLVVFKVVFHWSSFNETVCCSHFRPGRRTRRGPYRSSS